MVKGFSRQVIVVHSPEEKMFEQAIFILKDGTAGVTDDALMKEATQLIRSSGGGSWLSPHAVGPLWALAGAAVTGFVWLLSALI